MPNQSSTPIANRDAVPSVLTSSNNGAQGNLWNVAGVCPVTTSEVSTNVLRLASIPSNARVTSVRAFSTALGGSTAGDVGLYRNTRDGGAVLDADFFGSAVSFVSAVTGTEVIGESGVFTPIMRQQPLWQALGLSSDPRTTFDLAITLTANVGAAGTVGATADYVI